MTADQPGSLSDRRDAWRSRPCVCKFDRCDREILLTKTYNLSVGLGKFAKNSRSFGFLAYLTQDQFISFQRELAGIAFALLAGRDLADTSIEAACRYIAFTSTAKQDFAYKYS